MIALVAAWRWLAGLPRVLLVCLLAAVLIVGGLFFAYHAGHRSGEVSVHRNALADSVTRTEKIKERVRAEWDTSRKRALEETKLADSGRVIRQRLRESVTPLLDSLPDPVVRLIHADDAQLFRDSVTIAAHVTASQNAVRVAFVSDALDTLRLNTIAIGVAPKPTHRWRYVVAGAALVVASGFLIHAVR